MKNQSKILLAVLILPVLYSCTDSSAIVQENAANDQRIMALKLVLPATPYNYANQQLPVHLNNPQIQGQINTPPNNPITNDGATLGRVLFYDKNLSVNNSIACAGCHKQANAFSDPVAFSTGFAGGKTTRNSMSLINARYYPNGRFFWDERAQNAEAQASMPIVHPVEMGLTMDSVVKKLRKIDYYPGLFSKAFGSNQIDSARIVRALAQFVRSVISYRTKYDAGRAVLPPNANPGTTPFQNFSAAENEGKALFFGPAQCARCHGTETFTAPVAKNNGLDIVSADRGVGAITNNPQQNAFFKAPSLRSIELSAPYMHDGRFTTLEQVIEHYNSGVKNAATLAPELRNPNGTPRRLNLTQQQKNSLLAFLKTLTDTGINTDAKFSDPFMPALAAHRDDYPRAEQ
jgi:cytochrome c peroxidase